MQADGSPRRGLIFRIQQRLCGVAAPCWELGLLLGRLKCPLLLHMSSWKQKDNLAYSQALEEWMLHSAAVVCMEANYRG